MGNITHEFVSAIPDGDDETLVRPSNWNAEHEVSAPVAGHDVATKQYVDNADAVLDYGLSFKGEVTAVADTTHFTVASLVGMGAGFFKPLAGSPYEIYVVQADGAAPEGEQTPVVAYTSTTGNFQHTALTGSLAVGDIVLVIHPLIASLGTKATDAATGAVTTTDFLMAYIKQVVTELQVADALIDAIKAKTDNLPTDPADQSLIMAAIAVVDGIVDDIKVVTAAIPDAGALTALLASIASILTDTETTIPGTITTLQATATAIKAITDVIPDAGALTTLLANVAATLEDTSTTLPATLATIASYIDTEIAAITPAGPTKGEMDNAHALLATVAKQDIIDGIVDNILIDTAVIGALGAGLTAIPWNAAWDIQVESEVTDGLTAYGMTAAWAAVLANYTAAKADFLDELISAPKAIKSLDWKGNFNWDTDVYTTNETDISALFSTNLAITTRRKYIVKLDLTTVEADGDFTELYLAVKEKIDGANYRAIDRKTVTKAQIAATAEPGIIIEIPATSENIQITMQMETALSGDVAIYYAVVKEHLE